MPTGPTNFRHWQKPCSDSLTWQKDMSRYVAFCDTPFYFSKRSELVSFGWRHCTPDLQALSALQTIDEWDGYTEARVKNIEEYANWAKPPIWPRYSSIDIQR